MATKKKKLFESIVQGASGTLAGQPKEWKAPPVKQVNRGTGSQTTNTGRGTVPNGVEILQAAQSALKGSSTPQPAPTVPQLPNVPAALKPDTGKVLSPSERVELVRQHEEQKQKTRKVQEAAAKQALGDDEVADYITKRDKAAKELKGLSLGDVLSDPVYAAGTVLENLDYGVSDVVRKFVSSKKAKEISERNAAYQNAAPATQGGASAADLVGDFVNRGAANYNAGVAETANTYLGAPLRAVGWEDNPLKRFSDAMSAEQAERQAIYDRDYEQADGVQKKVGEIGSSAVEAMPDMILLSHGGSTASGALTRGGARLAGREAALAAAEQMGRTAAKSTAARQVALASLKNPMFWTSFARTAGPSYEYAKEHGASDWAASVYATANAITNAQVEMGGGMQTLPWELRQGGSAALAYLKSIGEEGNEEVVQGAVERALQNLTYGADNPLFSTKSKESGTRSQITPDILSKSNRSELEKLGAGGNVDLTTRPVIDSKLLGDAGWNAGGGIATIYTSTFTDESERTAMNFTPIAVNRNGAVIKILSPRELQKYAEGVIAGTQDDYLHLKVGATFYGNDAISQAEKAAERIHEIHETAVYGNDGRTAIFDPVTAAKEWGMGAAVSAVLGAPNAVAQGVENISARRQERGGQTEQAAESAPTAQELKASLEQMLGRAVTMADIDRISDRALAEQIRPAVAAEQAAQNAQNAPVTNETPHAVNLPIGTETAPVQAQTWQNDRQAANAPAEMTPEDRARVMRKAVGLDAVEEAPDTDGVGNGGELPEGAQFVGDATPTFSAEDHIDNRTDEYIAKRSTKAFQHEHPELHEHFSRIAQRIMEDAMVSVDRGVTKVSKKNGGGTRAEYSSGLLKVIERSGLSRNQVVRVCQDIINDQGSENYAAAKRVELALDELMSDTVGKYGDAEYKRKKGEITGGTQTGSFDEYLKENELVLALGMATEDELRAEWEALQAQNAVPEAQAEDVPTDANGLPEGHGPMSPQFAYEEAPTQTHGSDSLYTEEERQTEGLRQQDSTHKVNTDAEVDRNAQERLEFDYDGEKADLFENKQSWDDADTALAHRIMEAEIARARLTGDYSEVVRLQRVWEARGTMQGQALRQRGRFAHTAADIVGEAATTLDGQDGAQETIDEIAGLADEWEQARAQGNDGTQSMIDLILRLNARRRTGGFFNGRRASRTLQNALNAVAEQDGGLDFLTDIAESQLRNLSADHARLSPMEAIKSVRYLAMLSKLNTTMRNLLGNTVFDITETVSNNVATPLDMLLSLRTGRRTTALDASWFSEAKRRGAKEAAIRAYIETALDADLGDTSNRFEQRTGRTHKMSSRNPVERFLSSMEKWQRYMLTVTDEFAKGGARAEQQRGIDSLVESGKLEDGALDGWAEETAKQRTFQNDGRVSSALKSLRDAGNNALSIRDRQGGSFGLGDAILPFAQVPGNIAGQFFNYSPFGLVKGAAEVISVLKAGENATAQQQAQAVRDVGRGLNGTAIVALFTAMAANGILKVAGDDDKDKAAMERDEGISGTQLNLDAALRWLRHEDTEWRDGDDLMSIGFLEPFNGDMAMGYLLAESYKDAAADGDVTAGERMSAITNANTEAALQAVMDLPAMSTLKNIGDAFEYSTAETTSGRVADAAVQFVGDTAASFVPNAVAGIAQGMDNGVTRVTRTSDKTGAAAAAENSLNSIKSKIPGLRSTLPQALDSWGQGRQTTATPLQNWFNANILPGAVTKYDTNKVNQELFRLMETQDVKAPARNPVREVQAGDDKKKLTTAEQQTYQRHAGQTAFRELQNLMKTDQYRGMRDSERAAAFNAIMEFGKVNGAQWVGGSAETPSWASKSDGSTAQNAAFYSILQAAKQRMDEDSKGRTAAILGAVFNRKPDGKSTVQDDGTIGGTTFGVMQQFLDAKQIGKVQSAIANGYDPQSIAEFWDAMNSFSRAKGKTKAWALANGYTEAQFNELYGIFIK